MFRIQTMWPFPTNALRNFSKNLTHIIVPELNLGQIAHEVEHAEGHNVEVLRVNKITGEPIHPDEIFSKIEESL